MKNSLIATTVNHNRCSSNPCGNYPCVESSNSASGYLCQCGYNDYRPYSCSTTTTITSTYNYCSRYPCGNYPCIEAPNSPSGYLCQCAFNDYRPQNNCGSSYMNSILFTQPLNPLSKSINYQKKPAS